MAAHKFSRAVTHAARNSTVEPKISDDSISIPVQEARFILLRLRQAQSISTTAVGALSHQNAEADADIACVLRHSLGAVLGGEIARFETLLDAKEE